jgi:splicing factor 3B subunit 5
MAVGSGEPMAKLRTRFVEKMIQPVGKPPERED